MTRMGCCLRVLPVPGKSGREYGLVISLNAWALRDGAGISTPSPDVTDGRSGGTSTLNSPMYKELSSDDETSYAPLFEPDVPSARDSQSPDDDEFTPTSTGSTGKKSVPKKRKRDVEKPPKPRKPRVKNPNDSPSKTHVNKFKKRLGGEMVRTHSESPLVGQGGVSMARVCLSEWS
jgi:hypothetical protein